MNGALAIFAKTVGLSPVKTRLAADIGKADAEAFYTLSIKAVAQLAEALQKQMPNQLTVHWALAEEEALEHPAWCQFKTLWTGDGDLGNRLHTIYSRLQKTHDYVMLIGTDSPQLSPDILLNAINQFKKWPQSCFIGPSLDGGFYLFLSATHIAKQAWTNVTYSWHTTLQQLVVQLKQQNIDVELLGRHGDVDIAGDFVPLLEALQANDNLLPAQEQLLDWLKSR